MQASEALIVAERTTPATPAPADVIPMKHHVECVALVTNSGRKLRWCMSALGADLFHAS